MMPITIDGLTKLEDLLQNETPRAAKRYISRCMEPVAQVVVDAAEQTAGGFRGVGILEESISTEKTRMAGDDFSAEISIGPLKGIFWGSIQEFGSQDVEGTTKSGKHFHHGATPAAHWLTRAWESCKEECLNAFRFEATKLLVDLENKGK
jgi:hypothetical protein